MKVKFTAEAQEAMRKERKRWRAYRDSKDVFDHELADATQYLSTGPKCGVYGVLGGVPVRRHQMPKCRVHLFYVIDEVQNVVRVVAVWGSRRGDPPDFGG